MELNEIKMAKEQAQVHYRQYLALQKKTSEDMEIMRGYRQLAKGTPLINLPEAIFAGGCDEKHRPKLAVCRADFRTCILDRNGSLLEFSKGRGRGQWRQIKDGITRVKLPQLGSEFVRLSAQAIVPTIPAHLRPKNSLTNYHILWEAEWSPIPPRDPALLKHIGADLYAVLAIWDLTELEQAIIAKRAAELNP